MDPDVREKLRKAGKINAEAREYGKGLIKTGASLLDVSDKVEAFILKHGGGLAFPTQISRNDQAAHNCAAHEDKTLFQEGDIVKLDLGVHIDGQVVDSATTINLGEKKYDELVKASREALNNAIKTLGPGVAVTEVGKAIQETIESLGFKPVRNLCGHGIGHYIVHAPPSIPNYNTGDQTKLHDGQLIAIEPFASTGAGLIYEATEAEVFMMVGKKPVRSMITRNVLKEIDTFHGLPFTTRWLAIKFSLPQVNFALRDLQNIGILRAYPPLIDKAHGLVSQAEHSIIVGEKPEVLTRSRE
ncbi:type II methionyl aminopeptidase [Candidatus Woesearchaeota archaeon]|nr:type II methionyl aminopeptidase [Candidatus Woesearchaeota archaeon]